MMTKDRAVAAVENTDDSNYETVLDWDAFDRWLKKIEESRTHGI